MLTEWLIFLAIFGLPIALMIYKMLFVVRSMSDESKQVMLMGLLADAEIISYKTDDDGRWVMYKFTPQGAVEPITCQKAIDFRAKHFAPGTIVPVRYMAKHPSISLLVPYAQYQTASS